MADNNYHNRPEWSYSQMKVILDSGIDYAVAAKRGMLPGPSSKAIDLGELAHMFVLGGDADEFVVTPYSDFRTKEAREWKAEQLDAGKTIVTTAQFDEWKYRSMRRHYDLQAATYSLIGAASQHISSALVNFYFCVVETVAPYRVQYHHASAEFLEHGETKLANCLREIKEFGNREPNFLIEDVNELGDFSL